MTETLNPKDVLEQQILMLNLVQGIERNQSDTAFQKDGGRIHYVFDENVFELFVTPKKMRSFVGTFQSTFWKRFASFANIRSWPYFAAQSALLTAEYLFSGKLPGQDDNKVIYMTEWHHNELVGRIGELAIELRNRIEAAQIDGKSIDLEKDIDPWIRYKPRGGDDPYQEYCAALSREPLLREDLESLRSSSNRGKATPDRFAAARIVARILSDDLHLEPLEQLARIVSPEIKDKTLNLATRFPPSAKDWDDIAQDALRWHNYLSKQIARSNLGSRRKPAAVWSDARSLALVNWVSESCDRTRDRVVFVTGDRILYNAYVDSWSDLSRNASTPEPFMLRRIVEYAPIFNMNREFSDIADTGKLMELTQQAMEMAMLPFNLSRMSTFAASNPTQLERGRHFFALKFAEEISLKDDPSLDYFIKKLPPGWFADQQKSLRTLCELWKQTERIAIGGMYELAALRLGDRKQKLVEHLSTHRDDALGDVLTEHANALLDKIVSGSVDLWYPTAIRFIGKELRKSMAADERLPLRAPIAVRLKFGSGGKAYDLTDAIERWVKEGDQAIFQMLSFHDDTQPAWEPELLYAVAAGISLGQRDWSSAEHYAHLAVQASTLNKSGKGPFGQDFELRYLQAVAKRFRLGEIGGPSSWRAYVLLSRRYNAAKGLLDECQNFHEQRFELRDDEESPHVLRLLRTRSERAALHGFFGASVGLGNLASLEPSDRERAYQAARTALDMADTDLLFCRQMGRDVEYLGNLDDERKHFLARLRRQYISNHAAATVVRVLVNESCGRQQDRIVDPEVVEMVIGLQAVEHELPLVVQAEICAYLIMANHSVHVMREKLSLLKAVPSPRHSLKIDIDLMRRICEVFL